MIEIEIKGEAKTGKTTVALIIKKALERFSAKPTYEGFDETEIALRLRQLQISGEPIDLSESTIVIKEVRK